MIDKIDRLNLHQDIILADNLRDELGITINEILNKLDEVIDRLNKFEAVIREEGKE